ncbi:hypothetical protein N7495_002058 [Penicillium taxi]|uniref:uncharacterized protein n=1 Tax=Penicillium taxi TaxID=168475 RepID=UPI0025457A00|nr:uncharacterized protein N7495_002058 [Penicillium taxi]KAJ5901530.1 hypothetical protein N7495_002058 [Penicillium taxi]
MDPAKSLPRLTTNLTNLPLAKIPETGNILRPSPLPSLFPRDQHNENIAHFTRYIADPQLLCATPDSVVSPITKTKSAYYEEAFSTRGSYNSPQGQVARDAVVVAELKTNSKVKENELKLLGDLMFRLAQIYQRPEASILVTVQQNVLLFYGTTTNAAYLLKISAIPSFIAPITNLRNTSLLQSALQDLLSIPPSNGIVIYTAVPEDNLGFGGSTAGALISRLDCSYQDANVGLFKTISRSVSRRMKSSSEGSAPPSLNSIDTDNSPSVLEDAARSSLLDERLGEAMDVYNGQSFGRETFRNLVRRHLKGGVLRDKAKVKDEEQTQDKDTKDLGPLSKTQILTEEHKAESV